MGNGINYDKAEALSGNRLYDDFYGKFAVDRYVPNENSLVMDDRIVCTMCEETKAVKKFNQFINKDVWVLKPCRCYRERVESQRRLEEKAAFEKKVIETREAYSTEPFLSALGRRYKDVRFSDEFYSEEDRAEDFKSIKDRLVKFVENFEQIANKNLGWYLWSENRGNGKTSLSACVRNGLLDKGISCAVMSITTLHNLSRFNYGEYKKALKAKCLIFDDIGIDKLTDWERDTFHDVVDYRYLNDGYVTCYTSNIPMVASIDSSGIKKSVDLQDMGVKVATLSRMDEVTPRVMHLSGKSMRVK